MTSPLEISMGFCASFFILLVGLLLRHCIAIKIRSFLKKMKHILEKKNLEMQLSKENNGVIMLATRKFTPEELNEATSNFGDSKIIGRGKHGKVYNGILPDIRPVVAVKKFEFQESSKFVTEVSILSRISHRNVARLLGYCIKNALVYDFINNGTLYQHIHEKGGQGSSPSTLTLELRMKIAAEIAAALAYMHSSSTSRPSIIHLNVNSKRILLDENYTAKLTYFKEAKLVPDDVHKSVRGSILYLDSKKSKNLPEKEDVYGFGVVLYELLTSRKADSPEKLEGDRNLANSFCSMEEHLDGEIIKEEHSEMAKKVAALARSCLAESRNGRPSMKDVATELEVLRFTWQYSAAKGTVANLNVPRSPKETDHLLGSPSKAQLVDIRVEG